MFRVLVIVNVLAVLAIVVVKAQTSDSGAIGRVFITDKSLADWAQTRNIDLAKLRQMSIDSYIQGQNVNVGRRLPRSVKNCFRICIR